ncbi:ABC transporter ATP-binding protein/permease [Mesomycoplasma neurolyticum]|nr:ABC transporter ATP-binding protein/permease [Mesomycoplasma neurolyticum]
MFTGEKIKKSIEFSYREFIYQKLVSQENDVFTKTNINFLSISINKNINIYADNLTNIIQSIIFTTVAFLYSLIYLLLQHYSLFLFSFFIIIIWIFFSLFIKPKLFYSMKTLNKTEVEFTDDFNNILKNAYIPINLKKDKYVFNKIHSKNQNLYSKSKKFIIIKSLNSAFTNLIFGLSQIGIIIIGIFLQKKQLLSNENSLSSIIYLSGLMNIPLVRIEKFFNDLVSLKTSKTEIINNIEKWGLKRRELFFEPIETICFKNVSLNLTPKINLFKNVNITLEKNDILKISGKSGVGKSTFANLLIKKNIEYSGEILLNNKFNIKNYNINLGYIHQELSLFPGTIKENIVLDKGDDVNWNIFYKVLEIVNLVFLKDKIESDVSTLSIGEKRRIEIARVLYHEPEIIIFDEAFTGIDDFNKKIILEKMLSMLKNKIFIFITHDEKIQIHNKEIKIKKVNNEKN